MCLSVCDRDSVYVSVSVCVCVCVCYRCDSLSGGVFVVIMHVCVLCVTQARVRACVRECMCACVDVEIF